MSVCNSNYGKIQLPELSVGRVVRAPQPSDARPIRGIECECFFNILNAKTSLKGHCLKITGTLFIYHQTGYKSLYRILAFCNFWSKKLSVPKSNVGDNTS